MSKFLFFPSLLNLSIYSTRFQEAIQGKNTQTTDNSSTNSSFIAPCSSISSVEKLSSNSSNCLSLSRSSCEIQRNACGRNEEDEKTGTISSGNGDAVPYPRRHFTHRREELRQRQEKEACAPSSPSSIETERTVERKVETTIASTSTTSVPIPETQNKFVSEASESIYGPSASFSSQTTSLGVPPTDAWSPASTATAPGPSPSLGITSSPSPTVAPRYYFCDVCSQGCFTSFEDAEAHLLDAHVSHIPEYQFLRTVVRKLLNREVWLAVKEEKRKDGTLEACGRRVLEEGRRKDPGPERMLEAHRAREQFEAVVQQWHPTARVYIFGSSVTFGIWDGMGDIDFTVVDEGQLRAGTWPPPERNAVRSITELLRRAGFSYVNLEPISHARVPIIKHHASFPLRLEPSIVRRSMEAVAAEAAEEESELNSSTHSTTTMSLGNAEALGQKSSATPGVEGNNDTGKSKEGDEELSLEVQHSESERITNDLRFSLARRLEAEDIISRSVRYVLNGPASWEDRLLLEASIREAVGPTGVQQVWWNRMRDMMNVTLDSTTNAIKAATCPLAVVSPTLRARIQPLHEDCRPELYNIDFDLSFRVFGIRNSQLLRRYLMQHPCARPGAMILKEWSKRSGVNNSVNGFLTSYAVTIMWLYFLLQKKIVKFVDPVKDVPASLEGCPKNPVYVPMVDPQWTMEEQSLYATQGGDLLVEFFYFYAAEFDWKNHVVSLNRPSITTKSSLGWCEDADGYSYHQQAGGSGGTVGGAENGGGASNLSAPSLQIPRRHSVQYNFCIEDPYEENLNLGRHMGLTKTLRVQTEFYRGLLSLLKEGSKDSCVFPPLSASKTSSFSFSEVQGNQVKGFTERERGNESNEQERCIQSDNNQGEGSTFKGNGEVMGVGKSVNDKKRFTNEVNGVAPPSTLAHKVLYRLMVVCLREIASSRRAYEEGRLKKKKERRNSSSIAEGERLSTVNEEGVQNSLPSEKDKNTSEANNSLEIEETKSSSLGLSSLSSGASSMREANAIKEEPSCSAPSEEMDNTPNKLEVNKGEAREGSEDSSADDSWGGVPQDVLRSAIELHAPIELKIGLKAWNWQQLLHRLGYKIHRQRVYPRREVGPSSLLQGRMQCGEWGPGVLTRSPSLSSFSSPVESTNMVHEGKAAMNTTPPSMVATSQGSEPSFPYAHLPPGVIPSEHAREVIGCSVSSTSTCTSSPSSTSSIDTSNLNSSGASSFPTTAEALRHLPSRGLTEEMQIHLSSGFLQLTPEWVPWSEPWAGNAIRATLPKSADSSPGESAQSDDLDCDGSTKRSEDRGGGGGGGLHYTPKTSFYSLRVFHLTSAPSLSSSFQCCRRLGWSKCNTSDFFNGTRKYSCSGFLLASSSLVSRIKILHSSSNTLSLQPLRTSCYISAYQRARIIKRNPILATVCVVAAHYFTLS